MNSVEDNLVGHFIKDPNLYRRYPVASFYFSNRNQHIIEVISDLCKGDSEIDILLIDEMLKKKLNNPKGFLAELGNLSHISFIPSSIENNISLLKSQRRIESASSILTYAINDLAVTGNEETIRDVASRLIELLNDTDNVTMSYNDIADQAIAELEARQSGSLAGVPRFLDALQKNYSSYQNTHLIIIAARPAMGKTAYMVNSSWHNVQLGYSVGVISAEQPATELVYRYMSLDQQIDSRKFRDPKTLEESEWKKIGNHLSNSNNLFILDKPACHLDDLVNWATEMKHKNKIDILYVDYLQRIHVTKDIPSWQKIKMIAMQLKTLARQLNIPIVCLAQVGRKAEDRPDKRPMLSDLRESGDIENESDEIHFLYRDDVYCQDSSQKGMMDIICSKNRHGPTETVTTKFVGEHMTISGLRYTPG